MLSVNSIFKWFLASVLFITFSGFSGDCSNITNFTKPQTEVVISHTNYDKTTFKYCTTKLYKQQQVTVNQHIVFNFKSLLNWCRLDFSITLKTQKQKTFEFLETNSILKQNLIAYKYNSPTYPHL